MGWRDIIKNRKIKIPKKRKQDKVDISRYYSSGFKQSEPVRRAANLKKLEELQNTASSLEPQIEYARKKLEFFATPFSQLSKDEREEFEESFKYEKEEYPDAKNPEDVYNQEKKGHEKFMIETATKYGKILAQIKELKEELDEKDTFEKEAGGYSFGGHGANPESFGIRYGKKRRKKDGKKD